MGLVGLILMRLIASPRVRVKVTVRAKARVKAQVLMLILYINSGARTKIGFTLKFNLN
jgi:hypothetical protein